MADKVSFPQIGNYNIAIELIFKYGMGLDYMNPPKMTDKTLKWSKIQPRCSMCSF